MVTLHYITLRFVSLSNCNLFETIMLHCNVFETVVFKDVLLQCVFASAVTCLSTKAVELGQDDNMPAHGFCAVDERRDKNFRPFMFLPK